MMKLHFPNPSRYFDEKSSRILFWGYDRTIEVSFFLETAATLVDRVISHRPDTS
jgi:hypothetical protein